MLTPGAQYLLHVLPRLFLPPLGLYIVLNASETYAHTSIPYVPKWSASVLIYLSWTILRSHLRSWARRREAKRLGAAQIPSIKGKLPGNIDAIAKLASLMDTEYIGKN